MKHENSRKGEEANMKKIGRIFLTLALILGLNSSLPVMAAEHAYLPEQVENMAGTVLSGGDVVEATDCAVMLSYWFANEDQTQESLEQLKESIDSYAQSKGYGGVEAQSKVYAIMPSQDTDGATVLVIGEGLEAGVYAASEGYTRRFAHHNEIWAPQNGAEGWQVISCEEQDCYSLDDDEFPCYYIELAPYYGENNEEDNQGSTVSGKNAGCSHVFEYVTVREPAEKEDGLVAKQCKKCGAVVEYQPISAIAAFLRNAEKSVLNAAQDAVVTVETDRWLCFDRAVMDAIASRPDVTVVVNYRYQHRDYTVTIPAGYDVIGLLDENGFCGFRYLDLILDGKEIAK